jgi:predicted MFS family arabinose efflux permease
MFLVCGLGVASWAPLVPMAKARLGLDNGSLGLLLLFFGVGAMITMPLTGKLVTRFGSKRVIVVSGTLIAAILPMLLVINNTYLMSACLLIFGASTGGINVAMNAQAIKVQRSYGKHIMSSFHGLYSIGGLVGSLGFGLLLKAGLDAMSTIIFISILLVLITYSQFSRLMSDDVAETSEKTRKRFTFPSSALLILGAICFISALAEGAMLDWSAVFLTANRHLSIEFAGVGYAMFSVAMALMRLTGDSVIATVGRLKVVVWGSIIASAGLMLAVCFPYVSLVLVGFLMVGLGCANIIPILFSTAGNMPGLSPAYALPVVTSMAYAGILAGPALIGFIAQLLTLPVALGVIGVCILFAGLIFKIKDGRNKAVQIPEEVEALVCKN